MKGLLIAQGQVPPRTHAITDLLSMLPEGLLVDLHESLMSLDDFYIPTRYPDALPGALPDGLPGQEQAKSALSVAQQTLPQIYRLLE